MKQQTSFEELGGALRNFVMVLCQSLYIDKLADWLVMKLQNRKG